MSILSDDLEMKILDNSPVACSVVELVLDNHGNPVDWIYRYCNDAFADMKGYRRDAITNHASLELFPEVNKKFLKVYYEAAFHGKSNDIEFGTHKNYRAIISPAGKTGYCSSMIYVVDKRISLSEEEERDRNKAYVINRLSPEYASLYRIELNTGKYEILRLADNTNAKKIVGKDMFIFDSFDDFVKEYANLYILDKDRQEFTNWFSCSNMKHALKMNDKITYHYHSVTKEGKHSYYEGYAVKGQVKNDKFYIFLGFRNIDSIMYKEKQIQEELENALEKERLGNEIIAAIAKTYQYISRIDINADFYEEIANSDKVTMNFAKNGKMSISNAKLCEESIAEEYKEAYLKFTDISTLKERMKDVQTIQMEYQMKDGSWHRLRFIEKKRDENGNLTNVICAARSISDAKRKEQLLMYQIDEAKKDAAFKTRFLSNMSHDIRTPINGILGMIDLAERYQDDEEIRHKCRDKIRESSKYLVSLVDDILSMSKLETEGLDEHELTFDLSDILNRANTSMQIEAENKKVEFSVNWECSEMNHRYLIGNPVYLERLLVIATDNAVKFTEPGGKISVSCRERYADEENVVYEFVCSDNGIGMSEEFVGHAFDMFSQENETSRTKYSGTGLGLAIAKKLAERMKGTIKLESTKGAGTTVTLVIPFKTGDENEIKGPVKYEEIPVEGLRVLIAEDNELNMEIAKFMLEKNGILVDCASNGEEAVEKYESSAPGYYDAIFMDIMMPDLNGWDATRKIRTMQRADSERIPIIAMSANAFAEDIINSRIAGMNEHLTKPLDENKMIKVLQECV